MNVGIIGLGRIGKVHLRAIRQVPGLEVIGVCTGTDISKEEILTQYQIPTLYQDYKEMIQDDRIQIVWVCSPSNLHYDHVSFALQHQKYVFCEKPLETSIEKIKTLIGEFEHIESRLMVGFNRRFDKEFDTVKQNLPKIGTPTLLKITSRDPAPPEHFYEFSKSSGGLFKDMTIHDLDMARYMTGSEVQELQVFAGVNYAPEIKDIDVDTAIINIKFKNGVLCNIDNSRVCAYGYDQRLEIFGDQGMLQVNNQELNRTKFFDGDAVSSSVYKDFFIDRYADAYQREAEVFVDCISNAKPFPVSAGDALKALEISEMCLQSLRENKIIYA